MTLSLLLFYLFSFVLLASSLAVISVRNTVYAVMFLILAFVNAACLFILASSEYLALLLIVVYVGAIAVLFLFVVMMLNVDITKKDDQVSRKRPLLMLIAVILFSEIFIITKFSSVKFYEKTNLYPISENSSNVSSIGSVLYTDFILPFQMAGVILFIAMVGAIVLTIRDSNKITRKQNIADQVLRSKKDSIDLVQIKSGSNLDI